MEYGSLSGIPRERKRERERVNIIFFPSVSLVKYGHDRVEMNDRVEAKVCSKERRGDVCWKRRKKKFSRCEHSTYSIYQSFEYSSIFISVESVYFKEGGKRNLMNILINIGI